jgi:hypothetical protein
MVHALIFVAQAVCPCDIPVNNRVRTHSVVVYSLAGMKVFAHVCVCVYVCVCVCIYIYIYIYIHTYIHMCVCVCMYGALYGTCPHLSGAVCPCDIPVVNNRVRTEENAEERSCECQHVPLILLCVFVSICGYISLCVSWYALVRLFLFLCLFYCALAKMLDVRVLLNIWVWLCGNAWTSGCGCVWMYHECMHDFNDTLRNEVCFFNRIQSSLRFQPAFFCFIVCVDLGISTMRDAHRNLPSASHDDAR